MIYGNIILENQYNTTIKSDIEIIQEYYNNEISFLESIIDYKDQSINESVDLETIQEGFFENVIKRIKELIQKFMNWIKSIFIKFKNLLKQKFNRKEKAIKDTKEKFKNIDKEDISTEEKEQKKKDSIDTEILKKSPKTEEKEEKRYMYISPEPGSLSFITKFGTVDDSLSIMYLVLNINKYEYTDRINDLKEEVDYIYDNVLKDFTLEKCWNRMFGYVVVKNNMNAYEILNQYEQNLDNFNKFKNWAENNERIINSGISKVKSKINNLPKDIRQENLQTLFSSFNKLTSSIQNYLQVIMQFTAQLSTKLHIIEANDIDEFNKVMNLNIQRT